MLRAAAANACARGAADVYTGRFPWPLGPRERGVLTELRDPVFLAEADKHYVLRKRKEVASPMERAADRISEHLGYAPLLPLHITDADPAKRYEIPFFFADDPKAAENRLAAITLRLKVRNLVEADVFGVMLNGQDLALELHISTVHSYRHQWLEYWLRKARPSLGRNTLSIALESRPIGLEGGIFIDKVEILVRYRRLADLLTRPSSL